MGGWSGLVRGAALFRTWGGATGPSAVGLLLGSLLAAARFFVPGAAAFFAVLTDADFFAAAREAGFSAFPTRRPFPRRSS